MTTALLLPPRNFPSSPRAANYPLDAVSDDALHVQVKTLTGRHNALAAELLAHLAEVDARGIYRERACSSLYTYCVYELRLSEDEAQRRARAAKTVRAFPVLLEMLSEGAIHLTGLLLLAPHLTGVNHAELLARARFRTKREIEHLVAELAPRPDVPARIEPLGPRPRNSWQAYVASLAGPVRKLASGVNQGEAPPVPDDGTRTDGPSNNGRPESQGESAPARTRAMPADATPKPLASPRYRVEFTASQRYVELLEEARNLLQHQIPNRDVARVHELAMTALVEQLRERRQAATSRSRREPAEGSAPARVDDAVSQRSAPARVNRRYVPADVKRAVWQRDEARCTFEDAGGRRCSERAGLELHHEQAFALGGPPTVENLRLLCRAHNGFFAERDFGRAHMQSVVEQARNGTRTGRRAFDPSG
jgi:hypothetical protein